MPSSLSVVGCNGKTDSQQPNPEGKTTGPQKPPKKKGPPKEPKTFAEAIIWPASARQGARKTHAPPAFAGKPKALEVIDQDFVRDGKSGSVVAFRFNSNDDSKAKYEDIVRGMSGPPPIPGVGDEARGKSVNMVRQTGRSSIDLSRTSLCFRHGNYVVHIAFHWHSSIGEITEFAKQLDQRLTQIDKNQSAKQ
ncbi:MAG: hypothetical protein Tsb009_39240 [Planctomycetaceae bacterium]